jgi:Asp-tRNA(Asn)/Glu-tRNA(Gln) amidotransferase B subunit
MYENDLVSVKAQASRVETILQAAKKLPLEQKAELVEKLLGEESGVVVLSANSHLVDYVIAQMNLLSSEGLAYVLRAIASRIAADGN